MAQNEVHVGDTGTVFRATLYDQNNNIINLSSASVVHFIFERPDGSLLVVDGDLINGGTDGVVVYTTTEGDMDQPGQWKYQVYYEIGPSKKYSDIAKFKVYSNLPI